jgi:Spy/CpxP family protein refolding chaperone
MNKLLALSVAGAVALGGINYAQAHEGHGRGGHKKIHKMHMGGHLEKMAEKLELTDVQKAQVQPIIDQAKPQIKAIHEEAMQKSRAVMENTAAQLRPLLTPEQQKKFDSLRAAHEKMREAKKEMREARRGGQ